MYIIHILAESFSPMSIIILVLLAIVVTGLLLSVNNIGPREYGLRIRRFGGSLEDNVVAFDNEAGYQADLLMPGQFRFAWWFAYKVSKLPWPSVPANQIGVVIAQVGTPLKPGAKSGEYKKEFGLFTDIRALGKVAARMACNALCSLQDLSARYTLSDSWYSLKNASTASRWALTPATKKATRERL